MSFFILNACYVILNSLAVFLVVHCKVTFLINECGEKKETAENNKVFHGLCLRKHNHSRITRFSSKDPFLKLNIAKDCFMFGFYFGITNF